MNAENSPPGWDDGGAYPAFHWWDWVGSYYSIIACLDWL